MQRQPPCGSVSTSRPQQQDTTTGHDSFLSSSHTAIRDSESLLSAIYTTLLSGLNLENATVLVRSGTRTFTPPPPPCPSACINSSDDAVTTTACPSAATASFKLWRDVQLSRKQWRWKLHPKFRWLHERPNGANGIPDREECSHGRAGVRGSERRCCLARMDSHRSMTALERDTNRMPRLRSTVTSPYQLLSTTSTSQIPTFSPNSPSFYSLGGINLGPGNSAYHRTVEKVSFHRARISIPPTCTFQLWRSSHTSS